MIDWKKIYSNDIAPVLKNFRTPPPVVIVYVLLFLWFVSLFLIILASIKIKLIGFVLISIVTFIGYTIISNYLKAKNKPVYFLQGVVDNMFTEAISKTDSIGNSYSETIFYLEINISSAYTITENGKDKQLDKKGIQKLLLSEKLYNKIDKKEKISAVIMPTATDSIHFVVKSNGDILK